MLLLVFRDFSECPKCDFRIVIGYIFREFYEPGAVMLDDEAIMIGGLLVGLNIIDCTFSIKDEDLDQPVSTPV